MHLHISHKSNQESAKAPPGAFQGPSVNPQRTPDTSQQVAQGAPQESVMLLGFVGDEIVALAVSVDVLAFVGVSLKFFMLVLALLLES